MKHTLASKRSPARTAALAAAVTLLVGLPVLATVRTAGPPSSVVEGDLQAPGVQRVRETRANFQPPAGSTCSDTPVLSEVPDPDRGQVQHARRSRHAIAESEAAMVSEAVMPPSPPAPPAPVPRPAPAADAAYRTSAKAMAPAGRASEVAVRQQSQVPVTAGVVDDNADFGAFQQFLQRHAEAAQLALREVLAGAVGVVGDQHLVAGVQQRQPHVGDGRQAAGHEHALQPAFERAQALFEGEGGGRAVQAVGVAALVLPLARAHRGDVGEDDRGGLVDRRLGCRKPGGRQVVVVNDAGGELGSVVFFHAAMVARRPGRPGRRVA